MPLVSLMKDRVTIVKTSSERFEIYSRKQRHSRIRS